MPQTACAALTIPRIERSREGRWLLLLLLAPLALFSPVVGNGFVFDDLDFLVHGETVHGVSGLWRGFTEPYWNVTGTESVQPYYRPLGVAAFTALWLLGGGRAWPFHLASVLAHAACVVLLALLMRRLGVSRRAAFVAGCLFAIHPAQVQTLAWSTCLTEILSTACVLGGLLSWTRGRVLPVALWLLAGLLFKETAIAGVLVIGVAELMTRRSYRLLLGLFAAAAAALLMRGFALGWTAATTVPASAATISGLSAHPGLLDFGSWLGRQCLRILLPTASCAFIDPIDPGFSSRRLVMGLLIVAAGALLALACRIRHVSTARRPDALSLGLLLAILSLLPSLLSGDRARQPLADRFLHLPLTGAALAVAAWLTCGSSRRLACVVALLPLLAAQSATILPHWASDESLFRWAVASTPSLALPYCGLAQCLLAEAQCFPSGHPQRLGLAAEARSVLESGFERVHARRLAPRIEDEQLRSSLGHAAFVSGDLKRAERSYREVISDHPNSLAAFFGLACVLAERGERARDLGADLEARHLLESASALFTTLHGSLPRSLTTAQDAAYRVEALLQASDRVLR